MNWYLFGLCSTLFESSHLMHQHVLSVTSFLDIMKRAICLFLVTCSIECNESTFLLDQQRCFTESAR